MSTKVELKVGQVWRAKDGTELKIVGVPVLVQSWVTYVFWGSGTNEVHMEPLSDFERWASTAELVGEKTEA